MTKFPGPSKDRPGDLGLRDLSRTTAYTAGFRPTQKAGSGTGIQLSKKSSGRGWRPWAELASLKP